MKVFYVRKQWSQTDEDTVIVYAETAEEVRAYYKALGDRGPRYVSVYEAADSLVLKDGKMKSVEL